MRKIAVLGTGYVGLVTGSCLADFGLEIVCCDVDRGKIDLLNSGGIPIYEEGLDLIIKRNRATGRLTFTTDSGAAVAASGVVFIAVGTPSGADGSADLSYVQGACRDIARHLSDYKVIVSKSTVPVGTTRRIKGWIEKELAAAGKRQAFDVISNPEFLREGSAVFDFMHPDRIILGFETETALAVMKEVYRVLYLNETPFVETNLETAEMIKYASNAFLAVKISFINEVAALCEAVGANVTHVAKAMGKDGRIGSKFLHPGPGYGGSCFPKDTRAFAFTGREAGSPLSIVEGVIAFNNRHMQSMVDKIAQAMGAVKGKTIAVLGLAFKPNTDDMREAASLVIVRGLLGLGARVKAFDPAAMGEAKAKYFADLPQIEYGENEYGTTKDADAVVILTEWNQFRNLDLATLKREMRGKHFFDFRNIYPRPYVEAAGFTYSGVGT